MSKFFTYEERLKIESYLKEQMSFGEIGRLLEKDRTTIAKEIKKHSYEKKSGCPGWPYNACKRRNSCKKKDVCMRDECKRKSCAYCKLCPYCNDRCPDFEEEICAAKFKPPYVCNGCTQLDKCSLKKTVL